MRDVLKAIKDFYLQWLNAVNYLAQYQMQQKNLHKNVNSISTIRAQLINKGIIYPIRYKELDFTVPEFDGFIRRLSEYKQWCKEDYKDV